MEPELIFLRKSRSQSGAGVDFSKEEPEPEWSRSQLFNKRSVRLFIIIIIADCLLQSML